MSFEKEPRRIKKETGLEEDIDESEEITYQEDSQIDNETLDNDIDKIEKTRLRMLKYTEDQAFPLCDYLTTESFINFIDRLYNKKM